MESKIEREKLRQEIRKKGYTVRAGKELLGFKTPLAKSYDNFHKALKELSKRGRE
jgi:hypothetical protein